MNLDGEAGASPDDPYAFLRAMPAMMSFKALLISALVKSLTRRVPTSGMMWRSILPCIGSDRGRLLRSPALSKMSTTLRSSR